MFYNLLGISKMVRDKISILYQTRHCYQLDVDDIVVQDCHGICTNTLNKSFFFKIKPLRLSQTKKGDLNFRVISKNFVVCKANMNDYLTSFSVNPKKCSDFLNSFPDKRHSFRFCVFMKELFVLGGCCGVELASCLKYNFRHNKWSYIRNMKVERFHAACTVFEGKIVMSGGRDLKSVEAYDHHEDKWTYLPDMIETRCGHSAVTLGNKIFVIGGLYTLSWEVFDGKTRKFSIVNQIIELQHSYYHGGCCIGDKIISVGSSVNKMYNFALYDVKTGTLNSMFYELC